MEQNYTTQQIAVIGSVNSASDVLGHLDQLQDQQKARSSFRLLRKMKPFFNGLQTFDEALKIFSGGSSMVALIWGSLKLVLDVGSTWVPFYRSTLRRIGLSCLDGLF